MNRINRNRICAQTTDLRLQGEVSYHGFTLIELLVVVSVISLLLAVLMPALGLAQRQGQAVVCKSNLKNIYLASGFFAEHNDGWIPPARWHGMLHNNLVWYNGSGL